MGKGLSLQPVVLGKLDSHVQKKKKKKLYPCITLYKKLTQNRLKIKHKIKIYKTKGKRRGKFFYDIGLRDDFFDMTTEAQVTIKGMVKVRLH